MKAKEVVLWAAVALTIVSAFLKLSLLVLTLPIIAIALHSYWTLGLKKTLFFLFASFAVGLIFETIGLKNGTLFGGRYYYARTSLMIGDLPAVVPFYWSAFIYIGYCLTNSFLIWTKNTKPYYKNKNFYLLPLLVVADGLIVAAIDIFMDPVQVAGGTWTWIDKGPYFGIPIGNFIGWFVVAAISAGIFRLFEYFNKEVKAKVREEIYLVPVVGYFLLYLTLLIYALRLNFYSLALIGSFAMLPFVITSINLYLASARRR